MPELHFHLFMLRIMRYIQNLEYIVIEHTRYIHGNRGPMRNRQCGAATMENRFGRPKKRVYTVQQLYTVQYVAYSTVYAAAGVRDSEPVLRTAVAFFCQDRSVRQSFEYHVRYCVKRTGFGY